MVDSKIAKFYEDLEEVGDVQLSSIPLFEIDDAPFISNDEAKELIIECVRAFNGLYGKSGICKILYGSKSITYDEYNSKARDSVFYAALKSRKQKQITALIEELINDKKLKITFSTSAHPMLVIA